MPDIVDSKTRSRMMSGIRGRNTRPELLIRKALHARGFRYRLDAKDVLGKPDILLPRYRAAIFVHGCFWHGHRCILVKKPVDTNGAFWAAKIARNRERDAEVREAVAGSRWRQLTIWECALRGKHRLDFEALIDRIALWIRGGERFLELEGRA